jgi:hypothetical protein
MDMNKVNNLLGRLEMYDQDTECKKSGRRIKIIGNVLGSGSFGVIQAVTGEFATVKLDDTSIRNYNLKDIILATQEMLNEGKENKEDNIPQLTILKKYAKKLNIKENEVGYIFLNNMIKEIIESIKA